MTEKAGILISFDPNLRPLLWKSLDDAKEAVFYGLAHCQILEISDNEIQWLTGEDDYSKGVEWINERYHIPLVLVSMGKQGSRAYYNNMMVEAAPFLQKAADSGNIEQIRSVCFVLLTNNSPFTYFPF